MPPVRFEPTISAGERPQTYVLDRAATGTGLPMEYLSKIKTPPSDRIASNTAGPKPDIFQKQVSNVTVGANWFGFKFQFC
jgi:hypothetical protein